MGRYWVGFSDFITPVTTSVKTAVKIVGAAAKRFECVELIMTGSGITAAADTQHEALAAFLTNLAAGTAASSPTPSKADQGANASGLTAGTGFSAEPTTYETNKLPLFGFNQRGGMRWAVPQGEGYKSDGGQTNLSLGMLVTSVAVGRVSGSAHWWEA